MWPFCANYMVVRGNEFLTVDMTETGKGRHKLRTYGDWQSSAHLLVDGDPLIDQSEDCTVLKREADEPALPDNQADAIEPDTPPEENPKARIFCYAAIRSVAFDDMHRLIAVRMWPIPCLLAKPDDSGNEKSNEAPLAPGLTREGNNCLADDREALRRVARASEAALAKSGMPLPTMHWLRDGFH